ncbi:MAG TPA: TAXI family TRAP transporter solute-binding subunit [Thermodesulfobacteriota bacterium]|nr:TAXI family TRAP transporter solute-binding subunit [Thermodesulfobacteriota bacterium]
MRKTFLAAAVFSALLAFALPAPAEDLGIITGKKKGTYFQFGLNLAELVKARGFNLKVFDSAGSVENVFAVYKTPGTQLGIVQSDVLAFIAKVQTDPILKRIAAKIKMVFPLYNEEIHLLGRKGIADFDDLAGKVVAIGEEGSGIYLTSRLLFEMSDVKPRQMLAIGPEEALAQLKQKKIDAMFYVAGMPVRLFAEDVSAADELSLIPITSKSILEFYPATEIPANTYKWQTKGTSTAAVKAVLISYDFTRLMCDNVGRFSRIVYDNQEWLRANGHPKWKSADLNATLKGWEQYECVRRVLQTAPRRAPDKPPTDNPVVDAIRKMFSE